MIIMIPTQQFRGERHYPTPSRAFAHKCFYTRRMFPAGKLLKSSKLPRHDRLNRRASFEVACQCRREGFRAVEHGLSDGSGRT